MSIEKITAQDLRAMNDKEGLILQGCGGDPQEWLDGVNDLFTKEGLLLEGTKFEDYSVFEYDGLTNILFPMDDVKLDMGRLAMWRLRTHGDFGGTWLSDYVDNNLGWFIAEEKPEKPDCPLIGADGNIFNLMGLASRKLRENGMGEQVKEMCGRIQGAVDYDSALNIIGEYVNITSAEEQEADEDMDEEMEFKQY